MKTEEQVIEMVKHFETHANDKEESAEQQLRYKAMVNALKMVLE
jgi:hypothetical protein